jgi:hypothetical protein
MALNNRIYKYTCDTCDRSIERLADPTRPDPLRCVITDQCAGKLSLAGTRFGLRPVNTPTVIGLLDRVKRGTARVAAAAEKPLDKVSLASFSGGGLTLSLVRSKLSGSQRLFYINDSVGFERVLARCASDAVQPAALEVKAVLFELTPAALEYKRYTYSRTDSCVYVQGKDDSANRNLLTFDSTSNVRVLVNGALLDSTLYSAAAGTITFSPQLEGPSLLIEVFVYKSLTQFFNEDQALKLAFSILPQLDATRSTGAWGNTLRVGAHTPLYCIDLGALDRTRTYGLVRFEAADENGTTYVISSTGSFLLARAPYAFEDKRLTATVPTTTLTAEGFSVSFAVNGETGSMELVIDGATLQPQARPLALTAMPAVAVSTQAADIVNLLVERNEKAFIIGPA